MNSSVNSLSPSSSPKPIQSVTSPKWIHNHPIDRLYLKEDNPVTLTISCSIRRHLRPSRRRRHHGDRTRITKPSSPPLDSKLQMVIDLEYIPDKASISLKRLLNSSELKLNQFIDSGNEALEDLRTLITVDADRRVTVSCQKSTVYFMCKLVLLGFVTVSAVRVLVKLGSGFRNLFLFRFKNNDGVIRRRDRSLGGKEVIVGNKKELKNEPRVSVNPLSSDGESVEGFSDEMLKNWPQKMEKKLPSWWPVLLPPSIVMVDKQEYQRNANRLIRAIMDYRTRGKDIREDDIILLRRICRMSGVRVFIDTTNFRDSFYRASIDFTLNICGSIGNLSTSVQIGGEDAREFIAGLADNIGLDNVRAARMVAAAVAARTRSWLLQAWALEMQGKHGEAVEELSKLCLIHRIFPPEKYSPEMEMVARGLEKHLKVEQREYLLNMLLGVCQQESRRSFAEALGLALPVESFGNQQEYKHN